jgi:serine/threonine-protein kinase
MRKLLRPSCLGLSLVLALAGAALGDAAPVSVPDVVGSDLVVAERTLARAGLAVRRLGPNDGVGRAVVTGQSPAAGSSVRAGAQVRLTYRFVAPGDAPPGDRDAPRTARVPSLTGLDPLRAERVLQDAGFACDLIGPTAGESGRALVVGQHPAAGSEAKRGSTVRVTWRWQR